ncbi:DNA glycosylase [Pisolithus croceorrhizus]|nr:DNA glycosylase [Pisolithus croceorrhizus]
MRPRIPAPVDTMGCDQAQWKEQDPKTKDEVTDAAVAKLRTAVGGSLSVDAVIAADEATISDAISKVGFWRRKTQYIKQAAQGLRDDFDSNVPKMAFPALQAANLGIGVDVHVHRITSRLGWHRRPTKNPEKTRLNLQSWLPKELHGEINHVLVGLDSPKCDSCTLSSARLCPSAQTKKSTKRGSRDPASTNSPAESDPRPKIEIEVENA